ncbi:FHA domain-containing protein [Lysobacter sp. A3-1-A15]|uniref:FHA domain-containing protein n=1 Tax=Novilysobacter viscosus TaxID=3098602 RepID=UPI002ED834ED
MKLVFPGGEHPQVLLGLGVNRVGSDPAANVVIDRPGVNPQHCRLHVTAQGVMLDVPEGTPISVNGQQVEGLISLRPGDSVDLGGVVARLAGIGAAAPEPRGAAEAVMTPANDDLGATTLRPAMPKYALRGVGGSAFGRSIAVTGAMTIGRAPECTLSFEDSGLSRMHARLMPTDDGLLLEDMGSSNGSFINGRRVSRGLVGAGDEIAFDTLRFRLVGGVRAAGREDGERRTLPAPRTVWVGVLVLVGVGVLAWLLT